MGEDKTDGSGDASARVKSKCIEIGDRKLFEIELHLGETTIVSWKRLLKDANKAKKEGTSSVLGLTSTSSNPGLVVPSALDSAKTKDEAKDSDPTNRFSAVIEKIERLYKGKDSSDEEDLNDFPDDDEYDTEDSFIDDTELDEYFEVDNSAIKHDGFFVNRGKLERIEKPALPNKQQPKNRKRKELMRSHAQEIQPSKDAKLDIASDQVAPSCVETSHGISQPLVTSEHKDKKLKSSNGLKDGSSDSKTAAEPLPSAIVANGDVSVSTAGVKKDKQKSLQTKNPSRKLKDSSRLSNAVQHNNHDKTASMQMNPLSERSPKDDNMLNASKQQQGGNCVSVVPERNISKGKHVTQISKSFNTQRKDGSDVRPKSSILEKAIRDLEKAVEESKPLTLENQETDVSSQAVKRRLPGDIKVKLAKVARLAASHGKLSKELINRLMSSLGHFVQLRTLKRNLKVMITTGLSLKQEKENRFQQIKQEVADMVKMQSPFSDSKVNQQAGSADDFKSLGSEEKGVSKGKKNMDPAIEEKISDLYDLFVDGLDEDAGPQVRKFYAELAALWPTGIMDNHGIKRAICRAKERRREMHSHKDQETTKPRKILPTKTICSDGNPIPRSEPVQERASVDPGNQSSGSASKLNPHETVKAARLPSSSGHVPAVDAIKKEKIKRKSTDILKDTDGSLPKKKIKKKPEVDLNKMPPHSEKLSCQEGKERSKLVKEDAGLSQKSIAEPVAVSFWQSS